MPPTTKIISQGSVKSENQMIVDFINVGQGNAVLVSFPNGNHLLVDCGSQQTSTSGARFKHAQSYITKVVGKNQVHTVVITHGDTDHTAFIPYLLETQEPKVATYGGKRAHLDQDVLTWIRKLEKGKKTQVYDYPMNYYNLEPDADYGSPTENGEPEIYTLSANYAGGDPNSNSVVLLITYGTQAVLLTGDADWNTELNIMEKVPKFLLKKCTLLMLAHHGSYYSTLPAFLNALSPNFATISASGSNMSNAHPRCNVMENTAKKTVNSAVNHGVICSNGKGLPYNKSNTTQAILVTATNGDIRYVTDGTNYKILASSSGT
ncbi:MAG: MBL fold metallo-hydrolase [Flavobacteriaceae bacterium]|nr:MBL fold metallo-hydrolase [Flavobacteriaceae bacterium]